MSGVFGESESYAFIDGGHLRMRMSEFAAKIYEVPALIKWHNLQRMCESIKVFYYDAAVVDGESNTPQLELDDVKNEIRKQPGFHLCLGRLKNPKGKAQRQKMVDVQLAVDALSHVVSKNCRRVCILTGDEDFAPLLEKLNDHGAYISLICFRKHYSEELAALADEVIEISFSQCNQLLRDITQPVNIEPHIGAYGRFTTATEEGFYETYYQGNDYWTNLRQYSYSLRCANWNHLRNAAKAEFDVELPETVQVRT